MSFGRTFLAGAKALTLQAVVSRLLGLATSTLLARGLGPAGFGEYSATVNTANSIYGVVRLGVDASIHVDVARESRSEDSKRLAAAVGAAFVLLAASGLVALLSGVFLGKWLASRVFGLPALEGYLVWAGAIAGLQCIAQFAYAILAGLSRFASYARLMIMNSVAILVLSGLGMVAFGTLGAILGYVLAATLFALGMLRSAYRQCIQDGIGIHFCGMLPAAQRILAFGLPYYASNVVTVPAFLYMQGLLAKSTGIDALAIHRVVATLATMILFIPSTTAVALTTSLARHHGEGSETGVLEKGILTIKASAIVGLVAALGLCAVLAPLIEFLFGPHYARAVAPGAVGMLSAAVSCALFGFLSMFQALRRAAFILLQAIVSAATLYVAATQLVPAHGVTGYLFSELLANVAAVVVVVLLLAHLVPVKVVLRLSFCLFIVLSAAAGALFAFLAYPSSVVTGPVFAVAAVAALYLTRSAWLSPAEFPAFRVLVRRRPTGKD